MVTVSKKIIAGIARPHCVGTPWAATTREARDRIKKIDFLILSRASRDPAGPGAPLRGRPIPAFIFFRYSHHYIRSTTQNKSFSENLALLY
jgi:hypothetical protein